MSAKHGEFRDLIMAMFRERHKQPHLTVNLLRQHWEDILGRELARKTHPARIAGHTLWINALDASWAYQLQFMKREMLESVQVFMGAEDITELRFKQGGLQSGAHEAETKTPGGSTATADKRDKGTADDARADAHMEEADEHRQAYAIPASAIADKSLRDSFRRWARVKTRKKPIRP